MSKVVNALEKALDMTRKARMKRADDMEYGGQLYHGSTHNIKRMGGSTASPEGHFGSSNYLTTSADDASRHYAGEGPDLTQRIQLRAEQIANDMDVAYDDPSALAMARAELKGENQGVIYPVRTRASNTYDVSVDGDTFLEYRQREMDPDDYMDEASGYLDEADYGDANEFKSALREKAEELATDDSYNFEPEGSLVDFMDSIRWNPSVDDSSKEAILSAIQDEGYDGGIAANRLDEIMRKTEWYSEGDAGELINNEVYRKAVEDSGYDSILHDADIFPGMDVEAGTKHMIVFEPEKIRSVNAAFDPAKKDSANLLAGSAAAAVGLGAAGASEESEASFAGVLAKNADDMMLNIAQKMKGEGLPRDEIWGKTGWYEGVDGKWRFEVDDSGREFDMLEGLPPATHEPRGSIGDVLKHDDLYAAHPDLAEIRATQIDGSGGALLLDDGFGNQRAEYASESSGMHELQHGIQEREGFAKGGNPAEFYGDIEADVRIADGEIRAINQELRDIAEKRDEIAKSRPSLYGTDQYDAAVAEFDTLGARYQELLGQRNKYVDAAQVDPMQEAFRQYKNLAGEAEARNVQTRLNMTPQERRANPPWNTVDIPESEQIVRMKGFADPATLAAVAAISASTTAFLERRQQKKAYWRDLRQDLLSTASFAAENILEAIDMPMKGYHGLTAVAGDLMAGQDLQSALARGGQVAGQPIEQTAQQLGDATMEQTGSPGLATAVHTGAMFADPF